MTKINRCSIVYTYYEAKRIQRGNADQSKAGKRNTGKKKSEEHKRKIAEAIKRKHAEKKASMVKLVDTLDLGSSASRRGGSSPSTRTRYAQGFCSPCKTTEQMVPPGSPEQAFNCSI